MEGNKSRLPVKKLASTHPLLWQANFMEGNKSRHLVKKLAPTHPLLRQIRLIQPVSFAKDITGYKKSVPLCA